MIRFEPATRSDRKPKGMGPERREEILAHALRLFSEHGVLAVSTRQIAAAVGVSQPTLYAYFPTKEALVAEVCRRAFQGLIRAMNSVADRGEGRAMLRDLARVYVDFGLGEPDAYRVAFMLEAPPRMDVDGLNTAVLAGIEAFDIHRAAVARTLGEGVSAEHVDLLAQSLWASLHGLVSLLIARPSFPWGDRERLIELHLDRLTASW